MSYILDALRRADAERQRGQVPGLHAQPAAPGRGAPPRGRTGWAWGLAAALVLALLLALAAWLWRVPPAMTAVPQAAALPPAATVAVTDPLLAQPAPPPTEPAPALTTRPAPGPAGLPRVVSEAPEASAYKPGAAPQASAAVAAPPPPAPPMPPAAAKTSPASLATGAASAAAPRAVKLAELNAEQRRDLPPLAVGGSIWSEHAANRFVIVNGVLAREGEAVAAGVVLERIGPKAALLRWRGLLVELPL